MEIHIFSGQWLLSTSPICEIKYANILKFINIKMLKISDPYKDKVVVCYEDPYLKPSSISDFSSPPDVFKYF